jgi:hypothetical protein
MSRAERRLALQRAYAAKQERLLDSAEKLATRENHFHIFQQERAVSGTAAMIMELNHGENAFCFPGSSTRAFSEALRPRLTRQSYCWRHRNTAMVMLPGASFRYRTGRDWPVKPTTRPELATNCQCSPSLSAMGCSRKLTT